MNQPLDKFNDEKAGVMILRSEYTIGILGGMGSYATLHFFARILKAFPAKREWERPRILIDNRCTMPSRVRAYLYGEKRQELVGMMAESIKYLCNAGANIIIPVCNTAHLFLDEVKALLCEADGKKIINMIQLCADSLGREETESREFYVLATEGTIDSKIYHRTFEQAGLQVKCPCVSEYAEIRELIEAVKQDRISDAVKEKFLRLLKECGYGNIILGCTEIPVLYDLTRKAAGEAGIKVYDPLEAVLSLLKVRYGEFEVIT